MDVLRNIIIFNRHEYYTFEILGLYIFFISYYFSVNAE